MPRYERGLNGWETDENKVLSNPGGGDLSVDDGGDVRLGLDSNISMLCRQFGISNQSMTTRDPTDTWTFARLLFGNRGASVSGEDGFIRFAICDTDRVLTDVWDCNIERSLFFAGATPSTYLAFGGCAYVSFATGDLTRECWQIDADGNRLARFGYDELTQIADPAAPVTFDDDFDVATPDIGRVRLYLRLNGGGKLEYVALFPTGARQVMATEP
jgi:hypothetical protein